MSKAFLKSQFWKSIQYEREKRSKEHTRKRKKEKLIKREKEKKRKRD